MLMCLLTLVCGQSVFMERVSLANSSGHQSLNLTAEGELLLSRGHFLAHWNSDGRLRRTIQIDTEAHITYPFFDVRHRVYWLPYSIKSETGSDSGMLFYDEHGNRMNHIGQWLRFIRFTGDTYLAPVKISDFEYIHKNRFTFQLQELAFRTDEGKGIITRQGTEFGKITPIQLRLNMNYKLVWPVAKGDGYLMMNQLEPKVFLYDPAEIEKENRIKENRPWEAAHRTLDLLNFTPAPDRWIQLSGAYETAMAAFRRWQNSFSRISYFNRLGDGFVVAYTVPRCTQYAPENEACDEVDIYVVVLDDELRPQGSPLRLPEADIVGTETRIFSVVPNIADGFAAPKMTELDLR